MPKITERNYEIEKSQSDCRHCGTDLFWLTRKRKPNKDGYFYSKYEYCMKCKSFYFYKEYKEFVKKQRENTLF